MIYGIFDLDDTLIMHYLGMTYDDIQPSPALYNSLAQFPGNLYILTNATLDHAEDILKRLGIYKLFEKIYSRDKTELLKPSLVLAQKVNQDVGITSNDTVYFFDDLVNNLWMGKKTGWKTIWIHPDHKMSHHMQWIDIANDNVVDAINDILHKPF